MRLLASPHRVRKPWLLVVAIAAVSLLVAACGANKPADQAAGTPAPEVKKTMLQKVQERGKLVAGVNDKLPGFGYIDQSGNYSGFDIDFARAIAAAIFNDPNAIEFRPLSAKERFTALQTGEVDVLVRNTTWTISRDTSVGLNFAPVTFYDGQGMIVRKSSGFKRLKDMKGARICVQTGTTTELNLTDQMRKLGISFTPVVFEDADAAVAAYESGSCDGFTTDRSGLISRRAIMAKPEDHVILPDVMSKEPLAPAVLQGDDQWFDIVKWVVNATIQAEEFGITQANLDQFMSSTDPDIRRFLGLEGEFGAGLGLSNDFVVRIIKAVGNYGEIYDRNLGPKTPFALDRGLNALYTQGGLMYSPPFR